MRAVFVLAALAVGSAGSLAWGQGARSWEVDLARDIMGAKGCEVEFLSQVIERQVGGQQIVMAKVHCRDQRTFDATRRGASAAFEYRECEKRDEASC
ncbi:MAG: hypothetical protein U1E97_00300 [Alphaproteobacteria bacterium]